MIGEVENPHGAGHVEMIRHTCGKTGLVTNNQMTSVNERSPRNTPAREVTELNAQSTLRIQWDLVMTVTAVVNWAKCTVNTADRIRSDSICSVDCAFSSVGNNCNCQYEYMHNAKLNRQTSDWHPRDPGGQPGELKLNIIDPKQLLRIQPKLNVTTRPMAQEIRKSYTAGEWRHWCWLLMCEWQQPDSSCRKTRSRSNRSQDWLMLLLSLRKT